MNDVSREEAIAAVDEVVDELLAAAGCPAPPVDALRLAREHLGIEVCVDGGQQNRGRAQRLVGRPVIYLRPEPSPERQQWTVAHELGEHLRPRLLRRLGMAPLALPVMLGESLADLLAFRLLVPQRWFTEDAVAERFDLLALKARYATASHEVVALRMLDLAAPCIVTIMDNGNVTRRKSNAWPADLTLFRPEQECRELVHREGRPRLLRSGGWAVAGWPVHKPEWKREVLRTVRDD